MKKWLRARVRMVDPHPKIYDFYCHFVRKIFEKIVAPSGIEPITSSYVKKGHHLYLRTSEKRARTHCSALLECCPDYNLLKRKMKRLFIKMETHY